MGLPAGALQPVQLTAIEWIRFALYGKDAGIAPWVVLGCLLRVFFTLACWGYDPQRGFGGLTKRGGGAPP